MGIHQALLIGELAPSDPSYAFVKSLISLDEGGSTLLPVDAISGVVWQNSSANQYSTGSFSKFGSGCGQRNGLATGGYRANLTVPGSGSALNFTAELWAYFTGLYVSAGRLNRFWDVSGGANGHTLMVEEGTNTLYYLDSAFTEIATSATVSLNSWNHFAITADGTNVQVFYNGGRVLNRATPIRLPVDGVNVCLYSPGCCARGNGDYYAGYIDEARLTSGVVRYTSAGFSVPTAPYPRR